MKLDRIQKWEKTREMGAWKYGLIYGTIWALFVVAFVFVVNSFLKFDERMVTVQGILMMLIIYWVAGIILYRFIFWNSREKAYQAWKNSKKN